MRRVKRSDFLRGVVARGFAGAPALGLAMVLALATGGCKGLESPEDLEVVDFESVLDPRHLKYEPVDLTPQALEDRMKEADQFYAEPRSFGKVLASLETCMKSISEVNHYEALWRGARACAWIALEEKEPAERRREYADKGIRIGREAIRRASARVESHYFYALCLGARSNLNREASRDTLHLMRDEMKIAQALDEKFDFCGPHRFLGELYIKTDPYPTYGVGSLEQGFTHLKRAVELCPDYGENHLVYATALADDGQTEQARVELSQVMKCPTPRDRSAEHDAWLTRATALLSEM